jgi:invasion protein IalB
MFVPFGLLLPTGLALQSENERNKAVVGEYFKCAGKTGKE